MLNKLNLRQQQAIKHRHSPLLVLAGAGSGKTKVITEKIAYLVRHCRMSAFHITAVTFTNKAAKEMNSRIRSILSAKECRGITISTFHTLGLKIIRAEHRLLQKNKNFSIYDSDDSLSLLKNLIENEHPKLDKISRDDLANEAKSQISQWKNDNLLPQDVTHALSSDFDFIKLYHAYQENLNTFNAVDFDDLIILPVKLFKQHMHILKKWQHRILHLLVDEYQDTNVAQYELIKLLCTPNEDDESFSQFTVVGDDDQSIYCWRGARPENLQILQQDFPSLTVVKLEQNYRSTQLILNAANHVIQNNPHTFVKKLWSDLADGEKIEIFAAADEENEVLHVVSSLVQRQLHLSLKYSDFAILYRGNYQSRAFEKRLREQQIPYKVTGGKSFFSHSEIKDVMAYLKLLTNPYDDVAFLRIVNTPKRQIGSQTITKLSEYSQKTQKSLFEGCQDIGLSAFVGIKAAGKLNQFSQWIIQIIQLCEQTTPIEGIRQLLKECNYYAWLMENSISEQKAKRRIENVEELIEWLFRLQQIEAEKQNDEVELSQLVNKLILIDILEKNEEAELTDCVSLMTLHSAKGLEFPYVYIVGVEEELLPHSNSIENDDIEEERRLFYVGITRAKKQLNLSMSNMRKRYGEQINCIPSRFIEELPQQDLSWLNIEQTEEQKQHSIESSLATMRALLDN